MPRVEHVADGSSWPGGYSGQDVSGFQPGEIRDLSDDTARYLVAAFPEAFRVVDEDPPLPLPKARKPSKG